MNSIIIFFLDNFCFETLRGLNELSSLKSLNNLIPQEIKLNNTGLKKIIKHLHATLIFQYNILHSHGYFKVLFFIIP